MKDKLAQLKNLINFLGMIYKYSPCFVVLNLIYNIMCNYLTWAIYTLLFTKRLFDMLENRADFQEIVILVTIFALYFLVSAIFATWFKVYYRPVEEESLNNKIVDGLLRKVSIIDIGCYEECSFYDTYIAALNETESKVVNILNTICNLIGTFLSSMFFLVVVAKYDFLVIVLIIVPLLLSLILSSIGAKTKYKFNQEKIFFERKKEYSHRTIMQRKHSKDMKVSKLMCVLKNIYETGFNGIISTIDKYKKKLFFFDTVINITSVSTSFYIGWLYVAHKTMVLNEISIGDYILIATAIVDIRVRLQSFFRYLNDLISQRLYVEKFIFIMEYKPKIEQETKGQQPSTNPKKLEFRNVSFTYNGEDKPTLKNINFEIKLNETFVILGHNGAGKSTLIKLIMRLYDVTEGEILLDGVNIKEYDIREYRKLISTVFQQPQLFALSIEDNITMGNLDAKTEKKDSLNKINDVLNKVGLQEKIMKYTKAVKTNVTKEFDNEGVEFSGGEYQKIAMARAIFKNAPIIILDEPSASLDPIAEHELFENIKSHYIGQKEKMVVIISHRLSCALLADYILLIENGEIIEKGSHSDLIQLNGKYKKMFERQKAGFQGNL